MKKKRLCKHCGGEQYRYRSNTSTLVAEPCECLATCGCDELQYRWVHVSYETGRIVPEAGPNTYEAQAKCKRCAPVYELVRRLNEARFPTKHGGKSKPITKEQKPLYAYLRQWVKAWDEGAVGFTLCGAVGVGKSQALVAAARALVEKRRVAVRFSHAPQLLHTIKLDIERGLASSARFHELCQVPVLAIDEVAELRTEWEQQIISDVLLARYQAGLTTMATTNLVMVAEDGGLDDEELVDQLGSAGRRVASRMHEFMPLLVVGGADLRRLRPADKQAKLEV